MPRIESGHSMPIGRAPACTEITKAHPDLHINLRRRMLDSRHDGLDS
ncbi:MAG: hypothetical protein HUN04_19820 [Desulfobacter sp.]|nr:MAG: hypothetical protein HUN04_19820 [Desulfobacter sp.]